MSCLSDDVLYTSTNKTQLQPTSQLLLLEMIAVVVSGSNHHKQTYVTGQSESSTHVTPVCSHTLQKKSIIHNNRFHTGRRTFEHSNIHHNCLLRNRNKSKHLLHVNCESLQPMIYFNMIRSRVISGNLIVVSRDGSKLPKLLASLHLHLGIIFRTCHFLIRNSGLGFELGTMSEKGIEYARDLRPCHLNGKQSSSYSCGVHLLLRPKDQAPVLSIEIAYGGWWSGRRRGKRRNKERSAAQDEVFCYLTHTPQAVLSGMRLQRH